MGRITAIGALAALIRRRRCGGGAHVHVSQAEAVLNQLDTSYVVLGADPGAVRPHPSQGNTTAHRVYPCAGDDEWCVISLGSEADRRAVAEVIGHPESAATDALYAEVAAWTRTQAPLQAAEIMQDRGISAGPMNRPDDVYEDPQLQLRQVFSEMTHPLLEFPLPTESGPARYRNIPPAAQRPAPLPGADTREICRDILGMDDEAIDRQIVDGVLFETERKEVPL